MADLTFNKTQRGFGLITFEDRNGNECTLQESSLATEAAIWLGPAELKVQRIPGDGSGWHGVDLKAMLGEFVGNERMHLTQDNVRALLPALQHFAETGDLPVEEIDAAANSIIGCGVFGWDGKERRSDRYGSFALSTAGYAGNGSLPEASWSAPPAVLEGKRCRITAKVLDARDSGHIGDIFRGIGPSTPEIGEAIDLGEGMLVTEHMDWAAGKQAVGLMPDDARSSDWFDPKKLYRLHDQTVEITITPV